MKHTIELNQEQSALKEAYESSPISSHFGVNGFMLYVLDLYLRIEDLNDFATTSLTDGRDDKKIDMCYFNYNDGYVIIAQSFLSPIWGREAAPANKASDLNTGISWLLAAMNPEFPQNSETKP
ncbi:MAG: hypothetical protein R2911_07610 [Caldilineaceae bacterium]